MQRMEVLDALATHRHQHVVLMAACNDVHKYHKRGTLDRLPGVLVDEIKRVAGDIKREYGVERVFVCQALPRCNRMMMKKFSQYVVPYYNTYALKLNEALRLGQGPYEYLDLGLPCDENPCRPRNRRAQPTQFDLFVKQFLASSKGFDEDGVHPNPAGLNKIYKQLKKVLITKKNL